MDKESQAAASLCLRRFGSGKRNELDQNRQVFAFAIDSRMKNPNYAAAVEKKMTAFDIASMPAQFEAHKKWWAGFWAESFVEIPDKVIERQYYPAIGIGLESSPEMIQISINTLDYMQRWFDNNGDTSFFPAAACLGYHPDVIYAKLHEYVATQYRPNGMRNNKHGMGN